ncbi:FtsK/SpoIIIE domain-containing protein [Amycolatopsis sp. cg5]|uniref:FtsK/SpoIIIE domain-containing protein n=1 Tax=Amycolatopsis sp. cg5 TaxID=3238802 RepID=UPI0035261C6D
MYEQDASYPGTVPQPLDHDTRWPGHPPEWFLRVQVGHQQELDLKVTPHVLVTGAGKSSLLRTIVAGLAHRFSPYTVQFAIADDFLSGTVPHLATNASDRRALLARALDDEIWRRRHLTDFSREPALVLVFDDADRLIAEHPELLGVLATIGREPLGIYLVLSAADPTGLSGLPLTRLNVANPLLTSREEFTGFGQTFFYYIHPVRPLFRPELLTYARMLAADPGAKLPLGVLAGGSLTTMTLDLAVDPHVQVLGGPGRGKTSTLWTIIRSVRNHYAPGEALVIDGSGPVGTLRAELLRRLGSRDLWQGPKLFVVVDDRDRYEVDPLTPIADLLHHGAAIGLHILESARTAESRLDGVLQLRLSGHPDPWLSATPGYGPWHPPEPAPLGRARFDGTRREGTVQVAFDAGRPAFDALPAPAEAAPRQPLTARIGFANDEPVYLDAGRHAWIGGYAACGKSTLLRTIAVSLAAQYSPATVQFLVMESNATVLADLATLPNTAAYLPTPDTAAIRRFTALLDDELRRRLAADEAGMLTALPHLVVFADQAVADIIVVPALADSLRRLATLGERLKMSLLITSRRVPLADDRDAFTDLHRRIPVRVSLSGFPDPSGDARTLGRPVRRTITNQGAHFFYAYLHDGTEFQVARPSTEDVREVRFRLRGPAVRAQPLTPPVGVFTYDELTCLDLEAERLPLALEAQAERVVGLPLKPGQHLVILGAPGTGRSTVLRTILRGIARRFPIADALVLLLHDDAITGVLPPDQVLATSSGFEPDPQIISDVLGALRKRMDNPGWTGPRLFVVIDNHDLFQPRHDPLAALAEMLPHAADIGLSVIVAATKSATPEIGVLGQPQLVLDHTPLPGSAADDLPALPLVGQGELVPWAIRVRLPWSGQA